MSWIVRRRRVFSKLLRWIGRTGLPRPRLEPPPRADRIVILAPHPDDESLGCGGTAALCAQAGARVTAVVLTDGRRGDPGFEADPAQLAREREAESRAACAVLGWEAPIFLGRADQTLALDPQAGARLAEVLASLRPEVIFLPFLGDNHPDHLAVNRLLLRVWNDPATRIYGYEIWSPLHPNCVIDIGAALALKRRALECYRSQLARQALVDQALALNRYRGIYLPQPDGHAEAFFSATLADYRSLFRDLHGRE